MDYEKIILRREEQDEFKIIYTPDIGFKLEEKPLELPSRIKLDFEQLKNESKIWLEDNFYHKNLNEKLNLFESFIVELDTMFKTFYHHQEKSENVYTVFSEIKYLSRRIINNRNDQLKFLSIVKDFKDINEKCILFFKKKRAQVFDSNGKEQLSKLRALCSLLVKAFKNEIKKVENTINIESTESENEEHNKDKDLNAINDLILIENDTQRDESKTVLNWLNNNF